MKTTGKPRRAPASSKLVVLMKRARGIVNSGIPDLATNPKHLTGFGRKSRASDG